MVCIVSEFIISLLQDVFMSDQGLRILLASPRGFCAGVDRALEIVQRALEMFGPPVYVRHEIVHNKHVVARLKGQGVVFVNGNSPFHLYHLTSLHPSPGER